MSLPDTPSPCVGVCRLSEETRLCEGCMRTAREIARWPFADNAERLEIVQRLRERRRAAGITSPADSRPRRGGPGGGVGGGKFPRSPPGGGGGAAAGGRGPR